MSASLFPRLTPTTSFTNTRSSSTSEPNRPAFQFTVYVYKCFFFFFCSAFFPELKWDLCLTHHFIQTKVAWYSVPWAVNI
jgi:hypothetical protein